MIPSNTSAKFRPPNLILTRTSAKFVGFVGTVLLLLLPTLVAAHQTAMSTFHVEVRPASGQVDMLLRTAPEDYADFFDFDPDGDAEITQAELPALKEHISDYVDDHLLARGDGQGCETLRAEFVELDRREPMVTFRKTVRCRPPVGQLVLENTVMHAGVGGYAHMAQIQVGSDLHSTVFDPRFPTYTLELGDGPADAAARSSDDDGGLGQVLLRYGWQGVVHILLGLDHVLFVLCMVLAARRWRRLVGVVTTFTVAHSVTLVASALGWVTLPPGVVEPLIAASIAWLALELVLGRKPGGYLFAMTFAFGLLHGFGFSYVLRDNVGLATEDLVPALLAFNGGVEIGQLAVVAVVFPLLVLARDKDWYPRFLRVCGGLLLAAAVWWLIERTLLA